MASERICLILEVAVETKGRLFTFVENRTTISCWLLKNLRKYRLETAAIPLHGIMAKDKFSHPPPNSSVEAFSLLRQRNVVAQYYRHTHTSSHKDRRLHQLREKPHGNAMQSHFPRATPISYYPCCSLRYRCRVKPIIPYPSALAFSEGIKRL